MRASYRDMDAVPQRKYSRKEEEPQTDLSSNLNARIFLQKDSSSSRYLKLSKRQAAKAKSNEVYDALATKIHTTVVARTPRPCRESRRKCLGLSLLSSRFHPARPVLRKAITSPVLLKLLLALGDGQVLRSVTKLRMVRHRSTHAVQSMWFSTSSSKGFVIGSPTSHTTSPE